MARTSVKLVAASATRTSMVPRRGEGRISQRISSKWSITPVLSMSSV